MFCGSSLEGLKHSDDEGEWKEQFNKRKFWEDTCVKYGFELSMPDISEISKSGADLSCTVFHVNRAAYARPMT